MRRLDKLTSSGDEYTSRAMPWLLVLTSGLAYGHMSLADSCEAGSRANKSNAASFRRQMNTSRSSARALSLQFADGFGRFQKTTDESVPLALSYPSGSAAPIPILTKMASGVLPAPPELDDAQRRALERAVLLETCKAVDAADDTAKAQAIFRIGNVKVPRPMFIAAMANSLFDQSELYGRTKMNEPEKLKIFCIRAQEALKTIPETKQTKELNVRIQSALKKAKIS